MSIPAFEVASDSAIVQCTTKLVSLSDILSDEQNSEDLINKVLQQVEYYFSDSNIVRDVFLLKIIETNPGGWVPIGTVAKFSKMKKLNCSMDTIVHSLKKSDILELSNNGLSIRRKAKIPELDQSYFDRSVILFPDEAHPKSCTKFLKKASISDLSLARKGYIPKNFQRFKTNYPKLGETASSIYIFATEEDANKAIKSARSMGCSGLIGILSSSPSETKKKKKIKSLPVDFAGYKPRFILKTSNDCVKQVKLIREPIGPPAEKSKGFPTGWRYPTQNSEAKLKDLPTACATKDLDATNDLPPDPAILMM